MNNEQNRGEEWGEGKESAMNKNLVGEEQRIRIMIVEDNVEVAESIKNYLTSENFEVTIYDEAPRALTELKKGAYHLVLLDLRMPKMSGEEMLRKMRESGWNIPVIILTAYPSVKSAIESLKLQAFDYIEKPFKMSRLLETINSVIKERGITTRPKEILMSRVGERMRFLRNEEKLTLRQLATRAGVSPSLLSKIEVGKSSPSLFTIYKVTKSLQISLRIFFEDIEV